VRRGSAAPPNRSHYIWYNFNAGAGSAPFFVIRRITPYLFVCVCIPLGFLHGIASAVSCAPPQLPLAKSK